jgi:transposase
MEIVLKAARKDALPDLRLVVIMEATGMSWFTVGQYFIRHGAKVYRVNGQQVADLRRAYQRSAKSDRIDIRVLARLYLLHPERLHHLRLPSGPHMALQRACRERERLVKQCTASKNRLIATDKFAWLDLAEILPPYGLRAFWVRYHWYDPWKVVQTGPQALIRDWQKAYPHRATEPHWIADLCKQAQLVVDCYGSPCLDYALLQEDVCREQLRFQIAQTEIRSLKINILRPLYRQIHPQRFLETFQGIGQDSAAVYIAFIGDILRFPTLKQFRGWSGLVPYSRQSGLAETQGLHITQAGPNLIKATAFLNAGVARLYDPQIASIYYNQMVKRGKHHNQAICACATHLLNRIYAILRDDRPYQLRDTEGNPVSKRQARLICQQQFHVPDKIRRRNNHRVRRARLEQKTERRYLRRHNA